METERELRVDIDHLPVGEWGREREEGGRDGPFFRTDDGTETFLELLVVNHTGLWAAG